MLTKPEPQLGRLVRFVFSCCVAITVIAASVGSSCAVAQTLQSGEGVSLNDSVPYQVKDVTVEQKLGDRIPLELPLIDSSGRPVQAGYFIDGKKPTIITLNYSNCPMLCNVQLSQLAMSLNELGLQINEDFQLLTVSIDPNETTQTAKKTKQKYIEQLTNQPGASDGWAFCTAKQADIVRLADTLGFRYRYDSRTGEYYHPAMLAFISPEGVITRYSMEVAFPADDLKLALVEAGEGTVGSPVDQLVLWCFSYDPTSNSYVPQAWKIMRLSAAATVGLMLAALAPFWFGRRRSPQPAADDEPTDLLPDSVPDGQT